MFLELPSAYPEFMAVYTDWSFVQGLAGGVFIHDNHVFSYRLSSCYSIFTAKPYVLYQALLFTWCKWQKSHLLCTDFLSALQSLNGYGYNHPVVIEVLYQVSHFHKAWKSVVFCWVPDHTGLPSNEAADVAAKAIAWCLST
jgi:hypothetical protein